MEATILASSTSLCRMVSEAGVHGDTQERLRMVLRAAGLLSNKNATFAAWFEQAIVGFVHRFSVVKNKVNNLAARLQVTAATASASAISAALAGIHGDYLFRALHAMQLPSGTAPAVYLEVALAAQRMVQQDILDKIISVYERVISEGNTMASRDASMVAFVLRVNSLDNIIRKYIDLADGAAAAA